MKVVHSHKFEGIELIAFMQLERMLARRRKGGRTHASDGVLKLVRVGTASQRPPMLGQAGALPEQLPVRWL